MITPERAKEIMFKETPVILNGDFYSKINGLMFRKVKNGFTTSAELMDESGQIIVTAPITLIKEAGEVEVEMKKKDELRTETEKVVLLAAEFFEEVRKEKTVTAQEKLYELIPALLEIDELLKVQIYADEVIRGVYQC